MAKPQIYQKYVPYLTIEKQLDISESPEYVRIKDENQILQAETARNVVERSELQKLRAEVEAEKKAKEEDKQAWKSEVMGELEKKLLDALAVNEQEVNEWYGEPGPFIFEPGEMPDIPSGSDPLQGLELAVKEIGNLPEEFPDIIERIFKPKGKKE